MQNSLFFFWLECKLFPKEFALISHELENCKLIISMAQTFVGARRYDSDNDDDVMMGW